MPESFQKDPLPSPAAEEYRCYQSINGKELTAVPEDIVLSDQEGVISSILKGPDFRTCIRDETSQILFVVYAPSGIQQDLIEQHLDDIEAYIPIFAPESTTALKKVYG